MVVAYFGPGRGNVLPPVRLLTVDATTPEINYSNQFFIYPVFQSQNPLLSSYLSQLVTYPACYGYAGIQRPVNSVQNETKGFGEECQG